MKCDELKEYKAYEFGTSYVYHIEEVNAAIDELKQKLHDAEMQADLAECAVTEYKIDYDKLNAENRRLKRALWLARAYRAEARKNYWYARSIHEGDKYLWPIDRTAVKYIGCIKRTNFDWLLTWGKVEDKCLKKAEEYK